MMESAEYYINTDDEFCLSHLPCLNDLLVWGLTLFVDQKFPSYHDMTLTQYSAANRKPNTLRSMLQKQNDANMSFDDIIFPKTTNTKDNLFELAIRFGSKEISGDSNDIRCLSVLMDFANNTKPDFDIDFHNRNVDTPLLIAIRYKNEDAIKFLLDNNSDLFYISQTESNEDELHAALRMPIIKIFQLNDDTNQLQNLFDTTLKDYKDEIISKCLSMQICNKQFVNFLGDIGLHEVQNFLIDLSNNDEEGFHTYQNSSIPSTQPPVNEEQNAPLSLCSFCHNDPVAGCCKVCNALLCQSCLDNPSLHNCH